MKVVIITGMSGAGRSRAADWLEDQGYYCVDNMPPALIDSFLEMTSVDTNRIDKVAFVTDLRGGSFFDKLSRVIDDLRKRKGIDLTVLYMEAAPKEIVRRYNEVRRNHPLSGAEASLEVIEERYTWFRTRFRILITPPYLHLVGSVESLTMDRHVSFASDFTIVIGADRATH